MLLQRIAHNAKNTGSISSTRVARLIMPSATASRPLATTAKRQQQPSAAPSASTSKPLYASNASLPHLPVPSLSSTCNKYLETLQPLLTPEQLAASTARVKAFLHSDQGATLQARLEARASEKSSWLSEWFNEASYMGYRDRIVPFVNYFYLHKRGLAKGKSQTARAAELIRAVRDFRDLVEDEVLEPEKIKGKPLDTTSYQHMFGTSRIPVKPSDSFNKYPREQAEHVIVLRKNRFFKLDTRGRGAREIEAALEQIKQTVGEQEGLAVGALTSENRDVWAENREHLLQLDRMNASSLAAIESAILLVCLDDAPAPSADASARSWNLWCGGQDGSAQGKAWNRWFDKHQLIVDEAGESGFNGEHSLLDGTPTLRLNEFVLASLAQGKIALEVAETPSTTPILVEEIKFVTDERINDGIHKAVDEFAQVMGTHELQVCQFEGYGKNAIKQHKCSPDAWAQLVKQLAYGRMYGGAPAVTYESAQTRKFLLGRTEVIRSASRESKAFVDAMLGGAEDTERAKLFRAAVTRHIQYSTWAADAQGVDRHMFGLKKLLRDGEPMPEMFTDEAFAKSSHWTLSTSQLSSDYLDGWGYGPVVDQGFGLSYSIGNDYLRWVITSNNGKVGEFKASLEWAAEEVRRVMDAAAASQVGKAKL